MSYSESFNIIRQAISSRGGGIEISLEPYDYPQGAKMSAYQNYLGGGMLGAVHSSCNLTNWQKDETLVAISEELKEYYHNLTNPEDDEWAESSYEQNQNRPAAAY